MDFVKYEGLGNDFIVVDVDSPTQLSPNEARRLCDRHWGIGGDGVLLVSPPKLPGSRARMTVLNADGSQPEMCGNGVRCVALHLALSDNQSQVEYGIDTDAGVRTCQVERQGVQAEVQVEMGPALPLDPLRSEYEGRPYEFHRVSTGNPHAITFGSDLDLSAIDQFAPRISRAIPGGSNVEFVRQLAEQSFEVVVWERGVGRTLACGTGAVASAAAAVLTGRASLGVPLTVTLPGGSLTITLRDPGLLSTLRGPARRVFSGTLPR